MRSPEPNDQEVERLARILAVFHGGAMTYRNKDGMQTVASERGYGHFGDAAERYMNAHWQHYSGAAREAILYVAERRRHSKGFRRHMRRIKAGRG